MPTNTENLTPKQKYDLKKRMRTENDLRREIRRKEKMDKDEEMENLVRTIGSSLEKISESAELWADQQKDDTTAGLNLAIKTIKTQIDNYISHYGMYDHETGATEFPGNGQEYVSTLEELIEDLEALKTKPNG